MNSMNWQFSQDMSKKLALTLPVRFMSMSASWLPGKMPPLNWKQGTWLQPWAASALSNRTDSPAKSKFICVWSTWKLHTALFLQQIRVGVDCSRLLFRHSGHTTLMLELFRMASWLISSLSSSCRKISRSSSSPTVGISSCWIWRIISAASSTEILSSGLVVASSKQIFWSSSSK